MKKLIYVTLSGLMLACMPMVHAGHSQKKIERTIRNATDKINTHNKNKEFQQARDVLDDLKLHAAVSTCMSKYNDATQWLERQILILESVAQTEENLAKKATAENTKKSKNKKERTADTRKTKRLRTKK